MTENLDFWSENLASCGAKTDFLSVVILELLTNELCRIDTPSAVNQKILPGPNRVNSLHASA